MTFDSFRFGCGCVALLDAVPLPNASYTVLIACTSPEHIYPDCHHPRFTRPARSRVLASIANVSGPCPIVNGCVDWMNDTIFTHRLQGAAGFKRVLTHEVGHILAFHLSNGDMSETAADLNSSLINLWSPGWLQPILDAYDALCSAGSDVPWVPTPEKGCM